LNHQIVHLAPGLYFVATPIGTARDITLRALDILASADLLVAEDTRSMRRLMDIHGVPLGGRPLISHHDHSGAGSAARVLQALEGGQSVAYASEAGMPLIADPGYELSRMAAEAGHLVTVAPGASAVLAALTLGGLPTDTFLFAGFLPNAAAARRARLEELQAIPATLVFYESPKRIAASLSDMAAVLGADRQAALCRELTKRFEEVRRGTLADLSEGLAEGVSKGEMVVLVDRTRRKAVEEADLESELVNALASMSVKDAADVVSKAHDLPKRLVYQMALRMTK
jgi:16S rRNA (cytidine1402-2'-O)-methyltransferase